MWTMRRLGGSLLALSLGAAACGKTERSPDADNAGTGGKGGSAGSSGKGGGAGNGRGGKASSDEGGAAGDESMGPAGAGAGGNGGVGGTAGAGAGGDGGTDTAAGAGGDSGTFNAAGAGAGGDENVGGAAGSGADAGGGAGGATATCGDGAVEGSEECDDENQTPSDGCENDCTLSHNRVFITSTKQRPDQLGSLEAADDICNGLASDAGLPGTYVAYLSSSTVDARDRLGSARGWLRMDGRPFADGVEQLTNGQPWYPVVFDETGVDVGEAIVVTGSTGAGVAQVETCDDWQGNSANQVKGGMPRATATIWSEYLTARCDSAFWRLYCFGVDFDNPVPNPSATGRRVFVSAGFFSAGDGIGAADDMCQGDADAAGLGGSFKALIATESAPAVANLSSTSGPFVRTDGVVVETGDLSSSVLVAPINVPASAVGYVSNEAVWSGASDVVSDGTGTSCGSWSSTTGPTLMGTAARADSDWFGGVSYLDCSFAYARVYCVED